MASKIDPTRIAHSPREAAKALGLGVTKLYLEINCGRLAARKIGSRTIILRSDIDAYLAALPLVVPGKAR